ncbi:MAG: hypothetical protein LBR79_00935 [Oscillospiraceae bacterium]|nr:hypothetical protein [Oscillospiraceae bacterium]
MKFILSPPRHRRGRKILSINLTYYPKSGRVSKQLKSLLSPPRRGRGKRYYQLI